MQKPIIKPILLIAAIAILSCKPGSKQPGTQNLDINAIEAAITDDPDGQWTLCSVLEDGYMTSYNMCPEVSFSSFGTGVIRTAAGEIEHFTWTLKNDSLKIYNTRKNSRSTFSDSIYRVVISKHPGNAALQIHRPGNNGSFNLSRTRY